MARLTACRETLMRKECAGRGMVHANLFFELFEEIRALEKERQALSDLLFKSVHEVRTVYEKSRNKEDGSGHTSEIKGFLNEPEPKFSNDHNSENCNPG